MNYTIITGMSGAGKTHAANCLEDLGYYCIDNMPCGLFSKFAKLCNQSDGKIDKVAFVIDARGGEIFQDVFSGLDALEQDGNSYEILFLEASDAALIKRYKETRRLHPMSGDGRLIDGIERERELLAKIKEKAKYVVNTSDMLPRDLYEYLHDLYGGVTDVKSISANILSFGFKYGLPLDADLVFDVRFLPNPYYIPPLKGMTGLDKDVSDYVKSFSQTTEFLKRLDDMIEFLIPCYIEEGKSQIVVAIGCTGGRHRSVYIANHLYKAVLRMGYRVNIIHRDIGKG